MSALESLAESASPAAPLDSPEASAGVQGASRKFERDELENSRLARWTFTLGQAGEPALDALLAELEASEKRKRARSDTVRGNLRTTLDALLAELVKTAEQEATRFIAYSRNRNTYKPDRYATPGITMQAVIDAVDYLEGAKLVDHAIGYLDRAANPFGGPGGFGRRTRIRANRTLLERLAAYGISATTVQERGNREIIRLKGPAPARGAAKPLLDYRDTPETIRMRKTLESVNALFLAADITLPGPLPALEAMDEEEPLPELGQAWLYRVFNNGSFDLGGRFYGGWWMGLNKQDRVRLRINGEPVVELDYAGFHPRIMYDLAKNFAPQAPYELPGRLAEVPRDLCKKAFAQLLNSSGGTIRAPKGARAQLPRRVSWKQVVEAMEQKHAPVAHWFRKGRGLELQAIDARIAEQVLLHMSQRGIPCLPVHDSFIVPASQADTLQEEMDKAYRSVVHGSLDEGPAPFIRSAFSPADGHG
ncbi:hypothetical protein CHU93_14895 [Sandarakinorhabdus cyanobacteriorum]|uniref:Uncharacterized protein n=1 Tax=Sandarakinorhabdus cyanobacteriorum TaxID=1981098 RepID=A0A255Y9J2_9SPHN|nr:hypothetical protein [Sandarakinorhabdus cyanobacteriorum]OYQ25110.1 hypothetical protein CHU93_14895 [Sandarakinorhabdus cyanobacteriorum]